MSRIFFWVAAVALLAIPGALAQTFASEAEGLLPALDPGSNTSPVEIAQLIEQLESPVFGERQAASQKLAEAGSFMLPHLERAATADSREVSGRAFDILKLHFERGDADLKQAAKLSLGRLAESNNASIAQRARSVVDPPKVAASNPLGFRGPGPFPFGGPMPVQPPATRTTSISDINGMREVEIKDEARSIKMQTWPNGRIEIEIQDNLRGQPKKKIDAKNADDLKAKDAEIARVYEQFQPSGRVPAVGPPVAAPFGALPAANTDVARRTIESIDTSIERFKARLPNDPSAQKTIDALEGLKQQFRAALPPAAVPAPRPQDTVQRPVVR